jgi:hypothetical protein
MSGLVLTMKIPVFLNPIKVTPFWMNFGPKHFLIELFKPSFILLNVTPVYIIYEHVCGRTPLLLLEDQCKIVYSIKNKYIVLLFRLYRYDTI